MMLLFVWGQDYVKPGNVTYGFAASPIMEELGFQDGDQIMKIDGEIPFDVMDVNKEIMFHNTQTIEVLHPNGSTEIISIPEETDMTLFKADEMQPFSPRDKNFVLDSILAELPAIKAGFKNGDKVIAVNGNPISYWDEFTEAVKANVKKEISVTVLRGSEQLEITVTPTDKGTIGVQRNIKPKDIMTVSHKDYGFGESIALGFSYGVGTLSDYVTQFKFVFTKKGSTGVGGFGAIGGLFPSTWDWQVFWERTAFISIILAFMNILPIPALDGGHVLFLIYEIISGKPPSDKFLTRAQIVGMIILFSLLLYANGLDIYRWLTGG
jgi:regulator of sigma E protease